MDMDNVQSNESFPVHHTGVRPPVQTQTDAAKLLVVKVLVKPRMDFQTINNNDTRSQDKDIVSRESTYTNRV